MKIERVQPKVVEQPYATLTITASEYDSIRNALLWAQTAPLTLNSNTGDWPNRFKELYEQMKSSVWKNY